MDLRRAISMPMDAHKIKLTIISWAEAAPFTRKEIETITGYGMTLLAPMLKDLERDGYLVVTRGKCNVYSRAVDERPALPEGWRYERTPAHRGRDVLWLATDKWTASGQRCCLPVEEEASPPYAEGNMLLHYLMMQHKRDGSPTRDQAIERVRQYALKTGLTATTGGDLRAFLTDHEGLRNVAAAMSDASYQRGDWMAPKAAYA